MSALVSGNSDVEKLKHLLGKQLTTLQLDGLFHEGTDGKVVHVEEEIANARLPHLLVALIIAETVSQAITFKSSYTHSFMLRRIRATESTAFHSFI